MENIKNNKILNIFLKILYYIVVVFVCLIGVLLLFYIITSQLNQNNENYHPKISIYTIVSPSMTPTINVYDVVVNVREDDPEDIQIGDIITYISKAPNSEGMTITHRVIEVAQLPDGQYEYMTQGDNNEEPDSLYIMHDQVIGKKIMIIPKLGKIQFLIANKKGWLFLLLIPVAIYIFMDAYKLIKLFLLKDKVDKVIAPKEDNKEEQKLIEEQRKEEIKERLEEKTIKPSNKNIKHESFLEKYQETIVEVKENKYTNKKVKVSPKVVEPKEEIEVLDIDASLLDPLGKFNIKNDSVEKIVAEDVLDAEPKQKIKKSKPVVINEQFEILDTDELTTKIKEYDNKIAELDKMLQDMEALKTKTANKKQEEKIEEIIETNFLKGNRIKVVTEEETKNKKKVNNIVSKQPKERKKQETKPVEINLKPVVEKQITETSGKKKNQLNLDPKDIKKINRPSKTKLPIDELLEEKNKKSAKKKKTVKYINPNKVKVKKPKKKSIISIEKVR